MAEEPKQLDELFYDTFKRHLLRRKILCALPKMAKPLKNEDLRAAFREAQDETEGQIERLEQVFELIERRAQGRNCAAIEGILEGEQEDHQGVQGLARAPSAPDLSRRRRRSKPKITRYGTLRTWAEELESSTRP